MILKERRPAKTSNRKEKAFIPSCISFAISINSSCCLCLHPHMTFVCYLVLPYYWFLLYYVYSPSSSYHRCRTSIQCPFHTFLSPPPWKHSAWILLPPDYCCSNNPSDAPLTSSRLRLLAHSTIILVSCPNPCFIFLDSLSSHDPILILFYPLIPILKA